MTPPGVNRVANGFLEGFHVLASKSLPDELYLSPTFALYVIGISIVLILRTILLIQLGMELQTRAYKVSNVSYLEFVHLQHTKQASASG